MDKFGSHAATGYVLFLPLPPHPTHPEALATIARMPTESWACPRRDGGAREMAGVPKASWRH